jgi:hypothetical protein
MVAQLAVCRVPEDGYTEFASGALDDGRCGGGRADCEGWCKGEEGAIKSVEVLAVGVYEISFILAESSTVLYCTVLQVLDTERRQRRAAHTLLGRGTCHQ